MMNLEIDDSIMTQIASNSDYGIEQNWPIFFVQSGKDDTFIGGHNLLLTFDCSALINHCAKSTTVHLCRSLPSGYNGRSTG